MSQRRTALDGFKSGTFRVLVATDIAARGIDVKQITLVINYDMPATPEDYFHRIGRTGRAGHTGKAITLATPDQHNDVREIQKAMKEPLLRSKQYA
jgi:ATP-dependent RNA helicase RhlE